MLWSKYSGLSTDHSIKNWMWWVSRANFRTKTFIQRLIATTGTVFWLVGETFWRSYSLCSFRLWFLIHISWAQDENRTHDLRITSAFRRISGVVRRYLGPINSSTSDTWRHVMNYADLKRMYDICATQSYSWHPKKPMQKSNRFYLCSLQVKFWTFGNGVINIWPKSSPWNFWQNQRSWSFRYYRTYTYVLQLRRIRNLTRYSLKRSIAAQEMCSLMNLSD